MEEKMRQQHCTSAVSMARAHKEHEERQSALEESREKYRVLVESSDAAIALLGMDGQILFMNHVAAALAGLVPEDLVGRRIQDCLPLSVVEEVREGIDRIAALRVGHRREKKLAVDGEERWVNLSVLPVKDRDGEIRSVQFMLHDISARKQTEEALRRRIEVERLIGSLSHNFLNSPAFGFDTVVRTMLQRTGEFVGIDRSYVFLLRDNGTRMDNTHEWCAAGVEPRIENRRDIPSDTYPWWMEKLGRDETILLVSLDDLPPEARAVKEKLQAQGIRSLLAVPISHGEDLDGFMGFDAVRKTRMWDGDDITMLRTVADMPAGALARNRTEEALRDSEEKYRTQFREALDAVFIADAETGVILDCNPAAEALVERERSEIVGRHQRILHPEEDADGDFSRTFTQHLSGEQGDALDTRVVTRDGRIRDVSVKANKFQLRGKKVMQGVFRDISERKRAERDKAILEEQLCHSEKMRAIGQLAGGIAHDFNNVLGAIAGYADLIHESNQDAEGGSIDPVLAKRVGVIRKASGRAANLVSKQLAFSRRGKFRDTSVDLHEIIGDVLVLLEQSIDRNIHVKTVPAARNGIVKGDPSQLSNAILNIAINARDAMPEGGALTITTRNWRIGQGRGWAECVPGEYLVVSISDTGVGMDERTRARVFEPFFTTKDPSKGVGLGLASAYGTVRNHRGNLDVSSSPGMGTTFTIYLPVEEECLEEKTDGSSNGVVKGNGTVLVVDDDEMMRDMACDSLSQLGYGVHACADGAEAVAWYQEHHAEIDVVLLDMIMPVMDGAECCRKLKSIRGDVKVLLTSGYSRNDKIQRTLDEGALGFVEKPFEIHRLSEIVAEAVDKNRKAEGATAFR